MSVGVEQWRGYRSVAGQAPLSMITCYDYPSARQIEAAGVDIIFVGDSVGTNVLGYASPNEVTMADMLHHLKAVKRGVGQTPILVDMPYRSYDAIPLAVENAQRFCAAGADAVKLEGDFPDTVAALVEVGIPVCGHIGFTPQWIDKAAVQGKSVEQAVALIDAAGRLDAAGCSLLVLELIPVQLSRIITERTQAATIGIGAGPHCDGQVQVLPDVLGITERTMRHALRQAEVGQTIIDAVRAYHAAVHAGSFPSEAHAARIDADLLAAITQGLPAPPA